MRVAPRSLTVTVSVSATTSTAFAAALYCAPTRVKFFAATGAATEAAALADVGGCLVEWEGVLADLHAWMDGTGLNSQARV